ncbi:TRAP transporter small permease subunit [Chloroflexota bacterium]
MSKFSTIIESLANRMSIAGGMLVFGMMAFVLTEITLRIFGIPMGWSTEICELMLMIFAFFGVGYCHLTGGHVRMVLLSEHVSKRWQGILNVVSVVVILVIMGALAYQAYLDALTYLEKHRSTMYLDIPLYPFEVILFLACLMTCVMLLVVSLSRAIKQIRKSEA